jgi:hypothetical protein
MARIITGSPVRREELFGREVELQSLWELLDCGHVLLTAPRRHGKTSLMYGLRDRPREGWEVAFTDVEYLDDPADLLEAVLASILTKQPIRRTLERIKKLPSLLGKWIQGSIEQIEIGNVAAGHIKLALSKERPNQDWLSLAGLVTDLLNTLPNSTSYLVIIDEFPIFVASLFSQPGDIGPRFLQWFRAARQSIENVHFLVGGSVNLETSLARSGNSALINDLEVFRLRPFSEKLAQQFVHNLLHDKLECSTSEMEQLVNEVCSVVGPGVPFFLQVVAGQLVDAIRIEGAPASPETARWVYEDRVLGPDCRTRFDHYRSRLSDYYHPEDETRARIILGVLTDGEKHDESEVVNRLIAHGLDSGTGAETELVMDQLEADYYIERRAGTVRFLHRILADWWRLNIRTTKRRRR